MIAAKSYNGLKNYVSNNTGNSLREYIIRLDSKLNIDNYSNEDLKKYIEEHDNISFSRRNSSGKQHINYNTFRKVAGEVRTSKKIYTEVQRLFLEQKDQARAKTYEDVKQLFSDKKLTEAFDYIRKCSQAEELCAVLEKETIANSKGTLDKCNISMYDLEARVNADMASVMDYAGLFSEKALEIFEINYKKALKNYELKEMFNLNNEMFKIIRAKNNYANLENLIKVTNVYTNTNKIILREATSAQLETVVKSPTNSNMKKIMKELNLTVNSNDIDGQMSKLVILSDGNNMAMGSYDANGMFRTECSGLIGVSNETIFKEIIRKESSDLMKMSFVYKPEAIISALKENYTLAQAGSLNTNFEELLKKPTGLVYKVSKNN